MMSRLKKLIVILGPTASGKSELAIKLSKKFKGEIVSADSRQIYKEMDIGTAKSKEPQYLINIIKPNQEFTLAEYKELAINKINEIKIPFLVGGTGLYIQAIVDNLDIPQVKPNKELRKELEKLNSEQLFKKLKKLDPNIIIDKNNKRRLIRAIEICILTKKPFSEQKRKGKPIFDILQIGIKLNKKTLDEKINQRVEKMFEAGLINEVKNLLKKYPSDLPALSGIGYKELITYLNTELNTELILNKTKELIKLHTRQYAKRQMTWFKRDKRIKWIKNYQEAKELVEKFLS
ncbi:tRNA (adenosine(37)-N6)-dimethylallyltransferase MiaA [Patescibacteria group bacterium]